MARHRRFATLVMGVLVACCSPLCLSVLGATAAGAAQGPSRHGSSLWHRGAGGAALARAPDPARWRGPAPSAGRSHAQDITGGRVHHGASQAENWSGLVKTGADMTAVGATWTVPTVQPSQTLSATSTWVGLGGTTAGPDPLLIQTGTTEATATGLTGYIAWFETLPTVALPLTTPATPGGTPAFTVTPGDTMHASIRSVGAGRWSVTLTDETRRWSFARDVTYVLDAASAEWITERPTITGGALLPLADYSTTTFSDLTLASGGAAPSPVPTTPTAFTFVLMVDTATDVISAPRPFTSTGGLSVTDRYVRVPTRVEGATADGTAAQELEDQFPAAAGACPGTATTRPVVLATDVNYPDALASAYLASALGTGTLLTPPGSLSPTTAAAIRAEGITRVYVVGGSLAVGTAVVQALEGQRADACGGVTQLARDVAVTRIAGATLYDTAQAIAQWPTVHHRGGVGSADLAGAYSPATGHTGLYNVTSGDASGAPSGPTALPTAVLATGRGFQDAEAASTLAYAAHLPVLLTTPATLSRQAGAAIGALGVRQVVVMGGPLAVSDVVVGQLEALGVSVLRVAGADFTETAVELASLELASASGGLGFDWPATGVVTVARGDFYSDGLAGAVVAADGPAAANPAPLLLTQSPVAVGPYLAGFLAELGSGAVDGKLVTRLTILGGTLAVSLTAANTMAVDVAF